MIVVDTSAVIAILRVEPEGQAFLDAILDDERPIVGVASVMECSIVFRSFKHLPAERAEATIDSFLSDAKLVIEPVTLEDLALARRAHAQFGKGSGHGAALNFGDCFSYALAKRLNVPLLYKGGDFGRTDIVAAV